jgi:hypothetical protein
MPLSTELVDRLTQIVVDDFLKTLELRYLDNHFKYDDFLVPKLFLMCDRQFDGLDEVS